MSLSHSASNSFDLLDLRIRKWIWDKKWTELHPSQEEAIPLIIGARTDVIIAAPTSSGKTEAAFLPILTNVLLEERQSVRVLYVGPLKALINDQFGRLELLCEDLQIPIHRWHGDVAGSAKTKLIKDPSGVLLITPESLEALLMRHGTKLRNVFSGLEYFVIDELHSFIGTERGAQLRSLLHRIEVLISRRVTRIGLSATLANPLDAAEFLRPGDGQSVKLVSATDSSEIDIDLTTFIIATVTNQTSDVSLPVNHEVANHIWRSMYSGNSLIFCNRKADVEILADNLKDTCPQMINPETVCVHHGSLSKEIREDVEYRLKLGDVPIKCVCTSTLEMGIDIGSIDSIAQIGPAPTVAALRQRVGRSGRRGSHPILKQIVCVNEATHRSDITDKLYLKIVQSISSIELMNRGWFEPSIHDALHLSTLIQQILSLIFERGGTSAKSLAEILISDGPFHALSKQQFIGVLKSLGDCKLIKQMNDNSLLLDLAGEKLVEHYNFYTAFETYREYGLFANGKQIGSMPLSIPLKVGDPLLFAGRRWEITDVDSERMMILLKPSYSGKPPIYGGMGATVHCEVRKMMYEILSSSFIPVYADKVSLTLLKHARFCFHDFNLLSTRLVEFSNTTNLFHWCGDREALTLKLLLERLGMKFEHGLFPLVVESGLAPTRAALMNLLNSLPPTPLELVAQVKNKIMEKHDCFLSEDLLCANYASKYVDIDGALRVADLLLKAQ